MDFVELTPDEEIRWRETHQFGANALKERCDYCQKPVFHIIKAPKETNIELWTWEIQCWKCKKDTPVVWPNHDSCNFTWESLGPHTFIDLPQIIQKTFPFFKIVEKKTMGVVEHGNSCIHCGAYQGDFFVIENFLEIAYNPEIAEKYQVTIQLTDDERVFFSQPRKVLNMHTLRKGPYTSLCDECFELHKKKKI